MTNASSSSRYVKDVNNVMNASSISLIINLEPDVFTKSNDLLGEDDTPLTLTLQYTNKTEPTIVKAHLSNHR